MRFRPISITERFFLATEDHAVSAPSPTSLPTTRRVKDDRTFASLDMSLSSTLLPPAYAPFPGWWWKWSHSCQTSVVVTTSASIYPTIELPFCMRNTISRSWFCQRQQTRGFSLLLPPPPTPPSSKGLPIRSRSSSLRTPRRRSTPCPQSTPARPRRHHFIRLSCRQEGC